MVTLLGRSGAAMRQHTNVKIPDVEVGFTVCRTPGGQLTRGPMAIGTRNSVNITIACPPGSTMAALYHTHPGGKAYPSKIDIESAREFKAPVLCISNDSSTRCFKVGRRR